MITLLSRWFIRDRDHVTDPAVRRAYGQLCGLTGIGLNVLLFIGKFLAGTISGSIAITADAFNNLSDAGSSVITLLGFRLAGRKPDPEHPFGHGRIEYISGLIVSGLILLMGAELAKTSFDKILHPAAVDFSVIAMVILAVSILVKLYMSLYNRQIGKKINSAAMAATAADSISDAISTSAVLAAMLVAKFSGLMIDGYVGMIVAVLILISGVKAAKETIAPLLGQAPETEFVQQIERIVMSHPPICGIHDLVVHDYGPGRVMISLHAEVPAGGDMLELHDVIDNAEIALRRELNCEAVIHMDPIVTDDGITSELRAKVSELVKTIDERITIHDFRIVPGNTHTNLIFDAVVPFDIGISAQEVSERISRLVSEMDSNYFAVVLVEHSYVK
ncbi:MAG: cation diffusion facilitator family transporter [Clostridiales bacterium]|nr:cation diffusion facilitator family transporter [Clostridiales bacterium]